MRFGQPEFLYLLTLIPLALLFLWFAGWRKRQAVGRLGDPALVEALSASRSRGRQRWKATLLLLALTLLVLTLARPQLGTRLELVQQQGVEVMVALDVSASMLAQDVVPNRLERAKLEIADLMERLPAAQIGVVLFAGRAFVQFPLTSDFEAARVFLDAADPGAVSLPGTAIGEAIRVATKAFNEREMKYKVLILLTDGEDHDTDPLDAAKEAAEQSVIIYPIGSGTPEGEPIPVYDASGAVTGFKKDENGGTVLSRLDEGALQEIARLTGGQYFRATAGGAEIESIAQAIEGMEKKELESKVVVQHVERFQIPAALALLAVVGEFVMTDRRRGTSRQGRGDEAMRQRGNGATGQRGNEATRQQGNGATGQRGNKATGQRGNEAMRQ